MADVVVINLSHQRLMLLTCRTNGWDRHQTPKSAVCHDLDGRHRDREVSSAFSALWSHIELPALHRRHFGGLLAALGQEAVPRISLVKALHPLTLPISPNPGFKEKSSHS